MKGLKKLLVESGFTPLGLYLALHFFEAVIIIIAVCIMMFLGSNFDDGSVLCLCLFLVIFFVVIITEFLSCTLCKCPSCGNYPGIKHLGQSHCPYCGANLDGKFYWQSEVEGEIERKNSDNKKPREKLIVTEDSFDPAQVGAYEFTQGDNTIKVRRAVFEDIPYLLALLSQVLEVHARIKPDYFISGHTKYRSTELEDILEDDSKRVYVAEVDGMVEGYAFCEIKEMPAKPFVQHFKYMYIDDLCVDASFRGKDVTTVIFEFVTIEARNLGCRDITLNVWEGNHRAKAFYEKMGMKPQKTTREMRI